MASRPGILALALVLAVELGAGPAGAADPGGEFLIAPYAFGRPVVDMAPDGGFVVVWEGSSAVGGGILAQRFDASGAALGGEFQVNVNGAEYQFSPTLAADPRGFTVAWIRLGHFGGRAAVARRFDPLGSPTSGEFGPGGAKLDTHANGRSLFVYRGCCQPSRQGKLFARLFDRRGRPAGGEILLSGRAGGSSSEPSVALDGSGGFVVVWEEAAPAEAGAATGRLVLGRRFDAAGNPRGGEFRVNALSRGALEPPQVASDPRGNFVVAWGKRRTSAEDPEAAFEVFARLYDHQGTPRTPEFQVHSARQVHPYYPGDFAVAMGGDGKFLIAWTSFGQEGRRGGVGLRARRFDAAGRPEGPEFSLNVRVEGDQSLPSLAADARGNYAGVWLAEGVLGRRLAPASRGADPCSWGRNRLLCDTAHDGGEEETAIPVRLRPGDLPLAGDLDGDGRDDPCVFRGGRFLCDTGHDGGAFEVEVTVLAPGAGPALPLLGDPDGEGRDDACLFRDGVLFCDTAHDGETAEVIVEPAAVVGDVALLGDLDGNGADEVCLFRAAESGDFADLLCDLAHDGGGHELHLRFAPAEEGDLPLLGDADGDGDDDLCLVRAGRFLCDTAHDGGEPELEFTFAVPGAVPLLGNLDGI